MFQPVTEAYRNKDIFHINGNPKTVGIPLGKTFSVRPTKITTIKESHKIVAEVIVFKYIRVINYEFILR